MDIVYGKHSVRAVVANRPEAVRRVVLREGAVRYLQEFVDAARKIGLEAEILPAGKFLRAGKLTVEDKSQGVFAVTEPRVVHDEADLEELRDVSVVLALDQVSDPQNFGTVLRNAAFFGVDAVMWIKNRAVDLSPTVSRVSVGGAEFVELYRVTNLSRSLDKLKEHGFWVYGLDERGEHTLAETAFHDKAVLVVGAEGQGLRRLTKERCDHLVRIAGGRPGLESLNAGVATAVALAEVFRSRAGAQARLPGQGTDLKGS